MCLGQLRSSGLLVELQVPARGCSSDRDVDSHVHRARCVPHREVWDAQLDLAIWLDDCASWVLQALCILLHMVGFALVRISTCVRGDTCRRECACTLKRHGFANGVWCQVQHQQCSVSLMSRLTSGWCLDQPESFRGSVKVGPVQGDPASCPSSCSRRCCARAPESDCASSFE